MKALTHFELDLELIKLYKKVDKMESETKKGNRILDELEKTIRTARLDLNSVSKI